MSRKEARTFQLPLSEFGSIRMEGGSLIVTRRTIPESFQEAIREDSLRKWWLETSMSRLVQEAAQVWINDRGVQIAAVAGVNVEQPSSEMTIDFYEGSIQQAFRRARGRTFGTQDIVGRLVREAKQLERKSASQIEWAPDYLNFLIDILAGAWRLSGERTTRLKTALYQRRFPQLNLL